MLTLTTKQVSSLSVNKLIRVYDLWPLSFVLSAPVRTNSKAAAFAGSRLPVSPCPAAVLGRSISPNPGRPAKASTTRFAWTGAVGGNVFANKSLALTPCTPNQQRQLLSSTSRLDTETPNTDGGKKETPILAPHFRTTLGKTTENVPEDVAHPKGQVSAADESNKVAGRYTLPHPIWSDSELLRVEVTHQKPNGFVDWFAYSCVQTLRSSFDLMSGYSRGVRTEGKWLIRIIFLETVAGVPGMVAAMTRHLRSLRRMQRDHGWIHTLLEEAENERMHLMTALELRKPGRLFTMGVLFTQGMFVNMFFLAYLCSPRFCHRFVGYLEEEAVITYTKLIKDLDDGKLAVWGSMAAPDLAVRYWKLKPDAMMRDMILAIRADEAHHREVNHSLSDLDSDESNPYPPGK